MRMPQLIVIGMLVGGVSLAAAASLDVPGVMTHTGAQLELTGPEVVRHCAAIDRQAMYDLGEAFDEGLGVQSDPKQALQWYLRAAACGHAEAMNRIGVLYA